MPGDAANSYFTPAATVFDAQLSWKLQRVTLGLVGWVGLHTGRGAAFLAGLAVAAGLMGYHFTLIRGRDRANCFRAFLHNNWVGGAIFAGWALDYLLKPVG